MGHVYCVGCIIWVMGALCEGGFITWVIMCTVLGCIIWVMGVLCEGGFITWVIRGPVWVGVRYVGDGCFM